MIEKITLCLIDESGEFIEIESSDDRNQSILDVAIADTITAINSFVQNIADAEIRTAEKFYFCKILQKIEKELKENARS